MNTRGPWIEHLMKDEGLPYHEAIQILEGFESIPCIVDGEHMATLIKKNAEVHFAIYRKFRGRNVTARRLRAFLLPILESEGFLTTKLGEDDDDRFILKLGFELIGMSQGRQRIYMLNEIKCLRRKE